MTTRLNLGSQRMQTQVFEGRLTMLNKTPTLEIQTRTTNELYQIPVALESWNAHYFKRIRAARPSVDLIK